MAERITSPTYLKLVRTLPCYLCGMRPPACQRIEAQHSTANRGKSLKQGDGESWPACLHCHYVVYHNMGIRERRELDERAVVATREAIAARFPRHTLPPRDELEKPTLAPFASTRIRAGA